MRFIVEKRVYLKCKIPPPPRLHEGVDKRTVYNVQTIFSKPKFLGCISLPNFLTHGAPLHVLCVREFR